MRKTPELPPCVAWPLSPSDARRAFAAPSWLLAAYIGTAPIYWLPGVPVEVVSTGKPLLFAAATGSAFAQAARHGGIELPRGTWGPLGFLALLALAASGIVQTSDAGRAFELVQHVTAGAAFAWCFANLARLGVDVGRILARALIALVGFGAVVLTGATLGFPDWRVPDELLATSRKLSFQETGFADKSTIWSNGLAYFVPMGLVLISRSRGGAALAMTATAILIGCQVASGGRGGLLAALCGLALIFLVRPAKGFVVWSIGLVALALAFLPSSFWSLLLRDLPKAHWSFWDLNRFAAFRLEGFLLALERIADRPLRGHGIDEVVLAVSGAFYRYRVHNLWLRLALEHGVLAPLFFLAMAGAILRQAAKLHRRPRQPRAAKDETLVMASLIVVGLALSMIEPGTPLGHFQINAPWWAAAGALLGARTRQAARDRAPPATAAGEPPTAAPVSTPSPPSAVQS